jgi:prepilin-type processing-associated H-X9-DG protein
VVIAIIAILAALLLPALAMAKRKAAQAACLSNQKQLAIAWTMYASENNDLLCGFQTQTRNLDWRLGYNPGAAPAPPILNVSPPPGLSGMALFNWKIQEGYKEEVLYKYAENVNLIHCPGDDRETRGFYAFDTYSGVIGLCGGDTQAGSPPNSVTHNGITPIMKGSGIMNTSARFLWVEENDEINAPGGTAGGICDNFGSWEFLGGIPYVPNGPTQRWVDCPAAFHGETSTFSYCDGHAEARKWLFSLAIAQAGQPNAVPVPNPNADTSFVSQCYPCTENP